MAKTTSTTATRSIEEIVEEFASITDSGALRLHQSRLAYEFIGSTEGKAASELRDTFRKHANEVLRRQHESELSQPGVTNLVNTWKYMLRANVTPSPEVAKAAFNFACQTIAKKEEQYVIPAIKSILEGGDAEKAFIDGKNKIAAARKKINEEKAGRPNDGTDLDETISFDSIIATLGMLTVDFFAGLQPEEQSAIRDALSTASVAVA
jgi:hypothetical protein